MSIRHALLCVAPLVATLAAPSAIAQNLTGANLTLSGAITQNGTAPNFFDANSNIFAGRACIGIACDGTEPFEQGPLRLKWSEPDILFEDSSSAGGISSNDWRLVVNDSTVTKFAVQDIDGGTIPFTIEGGVRNNSLWLDNSGRIGFGTSLPQRTLHVVDAISPAIRLEHAGGGFPAQRWDLDANVEGFFVVDASANRVPFTVNAGAPSDSFVVASDGKVGFGTGAPAELLHIRSTTPDTDAFALFDAAGSGSDSAFRLRQNGVTPTTWEFRNQQDSGRLNVGLAGGNTPFKIDNAANNNLLRLGRNGQPGEVSITGTLVVNNTALNVPDYVFADDYALRPLAEVRDFITANSHLPDVPSEAEIKANGVDMTAMQMTLLKKVEELTLYAIAQEATIAQLNKKAEENGAQAALIVSLQNRLDMLEATR